MKIFRYTSIIFFALFFSLTGCSGDKVAEESSSSTTTPDSGAYEGVGDTTALYLNISTKWETGSTVQSFKTCSLSSLTAPDATMTCNVSIPEGQMYYSSIIFTVGSNNSALCPIVTFTPYRYRRSVVDGYIPPGADTGVDCTDSKIKQCWGGAAPTMIESFPKDFGKYFMTSVATAATFTLPSESATRWYQGHSVNYLAANNLTNKNVDIPNADYDKNNQSYFSDYYVTCRDLWAHDLYTIRLVLSDEDTKTGELVEDEVEDWLGN